MPAHLSVPRRPDGTNCLPGRGADRPGATSAQCGRQGRRPHRLHLGDGHLVLALHDERVAAGGAELVDRYAVLRGEGVQPLALLGGYRDEADLQVQAS